MPRPKTLKRRSAVEASLQEEKRSRHDIDKSREDDTFNAKKCATWFREYCAIDEPDIIGPEGIEKLCVDLCVSPEDTAMLIIAWNMNAKRMGFFTLQEWLKGFTELKCDCTSKVKAKLEEMKEILKDNQSPKFKSVYRYAYDFAKDKDRRSMDTETAKDMLRLLLGELWKLYSQFCKFLDQSKYKVINKDQWCNILEFAKTINDDLSSYDIDGAWPVMLDEFVEWLKNENAMQSEK